MSKWVVLLRAVNVGKRQLRMAELRGLLEAAGYGSVQTYVQSGNVVLSSDLDEAALVADLESRLAAKCGFDVPVIVRTAAEMSSVIERCPFDATGDPTKLVVSFAGAAITTADLGDIDPQGFEAERFAIDGRELYLWLPDGQGRSPLVQALAKRRAGKEFTARNWRTVMTLADWATQV